MRVGVTYHLAGFGLWRLGTEDHRLWNFYSVAHTDSEFAVCIDADTQLRPDAVRTPISMPLRWYPVPSAPSGRKLSCGLAV